MAEKNKFTCPEGHNFESFAKIRAFCPECGKSTKRSYSAETKESESVQTTGSAGETSAEEKDGDDKENDGEPEAENGDDQQRQENVQQQPEQSSPTKGPKKIKVVRNKREEEKPPTSQIKRITAKKKTAPVVKQRVLTNIDKKEAKENPPSNSMWSQIRRKYWFGG